MASTIVSGSLWGTKAANVPILFLSVGIWCSDKICSALVLCKVVLTAMSEMTDTCGIPNVLKIVLMALLITVTWSVSLYFNLVKK